MVEKSNVEIMVELGVRRGKASELKTSWAKTKVEEYALELHHTRPPQEGTNRITPDNHRTTTAITAQPTTE